MRRTKINLYVSPENNLSTGISKVLSPPSAIDPAATAAELRERLTDALDSRDIIP
ncbi:hypothetical protein [Amycolatopsis sp. NPDC051371]|uniref:hypothetical protein n=1 Tax=Amycolatopsis sp. NPDC051371 TaxID=3155800 RepID=UPI00341CC8AD